MKACSSGIEVDGRRLGCLRTFGHGGMHVCMGPGIASYRWGYQEDTFTGQYEQEIAMLMRENAELQATAERRLERIRELEREQ